MDLYEQLVETYLTVIEGCAVIPQVPILKNSSGENWSAYPDFLALNFGKQLAQVVEVNKSTSPQRMANLLRRRFEERLDIEHYIRNHILDQQLKFPFRWRFFIREAHRQAAESILRELGFDAEISFLETVFDALKARMP